MEVSLLGMRALSLEALPDDADLLNDAATLPLRPRCRNCQPLSSAWLLRRGAKLSASLHRIPEQPMPFVVTENCIKCKHTDCVEVCPVDCFHEGPNFLVIDPDECIDCTLCEPECPVNAIFPEEDVPAGQEPFVALNAELAKEWPVLTTRKDPPADAAEWDGKPNKLPLLER